MVDVKKVVLAYSGGLDTSVILKWLIEIYQCEVVTFTADVGQEEELEAYKVKVAELTLHIDLLKKLQPNYQSEKRSSGYAETKRKLVRSKGRAK